MRRALFALHAGKGMPAGFCPPFQAGQPAPARAWEAAYRQAAHRPRADSRELARNSRELCLPSIKRTFESQTIISSRA